MGVARPTPADRRTNAGDNVWELDGGSTARNVSPLDFGRNVALGSPTRNAAAAGRLTAFPFVSLRIRGGVRELL